MASTTGSESVDPGSTQVVDPPADPTDGPSTPAAAPPNDGGSGDGDAPRTGGPGGGNTPVSPVSYGWPNWLRRSIITVLLLGCLSLLVYANNRAHVGERAKDLDPVIIQQIPPPDGRALRQTTISADLKSGYDGRLTIDGVPIPESQMDGARDPSTVDAADLKANGLRPNNHNHVAFTPGAGKVIESLDSGPVIIVLHYFPDHRSESLGRTITWTINVT